MNHPSPWPNGGRGLTAVLMLLAATLPVQAASTAEAARKFDHPVASEGSSAEIGAKSFYAADRFDLSDLPHYVAKERVSGVIRIWGSSMMKTGKVAGYWEAGFKKHHPEVRFEYQVPNSVIELVGLTAGVADIGVGPRLTYNDIGSFVSTHDYEPTEIRFATGAYDVPFWNPAFAIFVNRANPIDKLTMAQLDGIFGAARSGGWDGKTWHAEYARGAEKNIRTWGQAGATGAFADRPIHPHGLNMRAHWATSISDFLLQGSDKWNEDLVTYPGYIYFPDGSKISGAESMVLAVAADPDAICYSTIFFQHPQTKVLAVAAQPGGPYVPMTLENVRNRSYPLTDAIYMYIDRAPGKPLDPKVREFMSYVLSQEGQRDIARDGKYLPLRDRDAAADRRKLD